MRRVKQFAFVLAAAAAAFSAPAIAGDIAVPMDQVRMVTFEKPVSTVYVGNPMVADVTVIDSKRVFVLGKAFGSTNVIALDAAGNQIADKALTVYGGTSGIVTLVRGGGQYTYACTADYCEPALLPGDEHRPTSDEAADIDNRQSMSKKAAVTSTAQ